MPDLPLDIPPEHPNGDKTCSCGRSVFWLFDGLCAFCKGYDWPAGPVDWTEMVGGGWYRLRQTAWTGSGVAPAYEYKPEDSYEWPEVLKETKIDEESRVVTQALDFPNKYGNCYETIYINEPRKMRKNLNLTKNRSIALKVHNESVLFVKEMKAK